jgi:hypothetical protein
VVAASLQHASTLVSFVVAGLAAIYLIVLAPELGGSAVAQVVLVIAGLAALGCFARQVASGETRRRHVLNDRRDRIDAEAGARARAHERTAARARLDSGFRRLRSGEAHECVRVLEALGEEFDEIIAVIQRRADDTPASLAALLPDLAEETYRHGMSALSDALELFEFAEGAQHRRLLAELSEIERRLESGTPVDERTRSRDEQRRASRQQLLGRHEEARQRACDLTFEAERCTGALAEARIELAATHAVGADVDVDTVVQSLETAIRHVREVQDELRRLTY